MAKHRNVYRASEWQSWMVQAWRERFNLPDLDSLWTMQMTGSATATDRR